MTGQQKTRSQKWGGKNARKAGNALCGDNGGQDTRETIFFFLLFKFQLKREHFESRGGSITFRGNLRHETSHPEHLLPLRFTGGCNYGKMVVYLPYHMLFNKH